MTLILRRAVLTALMLLAGLLASGCSNKKLNPLHPVNASPVVRLTAAPIDTNAVCTPDAARSCYSLTLNWVGYDPDGRVDHYLYVVDPPDPDQGDTTWIVTTENEKRLVFDAPSQSPGADSLKILRGRHLFVILAVDNNGAMGPRVERWFFSFTKAPTVRISNPLPVVSAERVLPPSIRVSWTGVDDDGVFTTKPVRYKYLLLGPANESSVVPGGISAIFNSRGAAIRRYYAPEFKASDGWITIGGETTTVQFTNLVPGARYMFTVVAFDEAGAFSPGFGFDSNIIRFTIGYAASFGPRFTVFNESFFYRYPGGSYNPAAEVRIENPAFQPITFNWFADPPEGAIITGYRWMLDGDVFDQRGRTDENTDLRHWSSPSEAMKSATIGPFTGGDHFFYIDAEDNTGLKSLATIHFFVVVPTFDRPLLIVDDLRLRPDQFTSNGDVLIPPQGPWPGAAEMDTFMYAVGGKEWAKYPLGKLSPPGILKGYAFDTLGTRLGIADQSTSLATLGHYQHVIWLIDFPSASFGNAGNQGDPMTSLRYMSSPGHLNSLGAYIRMGGEAWLVGGGGALATLIAFDVGTNNGAGGYIWNHDLVPGRELDAGRFMYDVPKWKTIIRARSALQMGATNNIIRSLGRLRFRPGVYAALPAGFDKRTTTSDSLPPLRTAPLYYQATYSAEFINADNDVREPVSGPLLDLKIDQFNDATSAPVVARWPSSDTLNTVVGQVAVTSPGATAAAGKALSIQTQGSGASTGDRVTHDFGSKTRDWSGLVSLKFAIRQDHASPLVQWRVRAVDTRGGSASALVDVGTTGQFVNVNVAQSDFLPDASSPYQLNLVRIQQIQFELEHGDVASTTLFDNIEVSSLPEGSVLDTLMAAQITFGPTAPINATMTVYHGHDFAKPFVFTGFAPWAFQRSQCKQLFDFVLQKLWGLFPTATVSSLRPAASVPTLQRASPAPGAARGVRGAVTPRHGATSGAGLRQPSSQGASTRRNAHP